MKRLVTILLASIFAVAGAVGAKPEDANAKKAAAKTRPIQPRQHINAGPKLDQNNIPKQNELRRSTNERSKKLKLTTEPKLETSKAPGTTNVVADEKLRRNAK